MSGHSKWSTIKRAKGVTDIKRGQTFTKLANVITIAVKLGLSGDPDSNPRLRMAVDEARSVNMPKENIQRAIERGLGKGEGQSLEEVLYEGFGPGKIAIIVEGVTDNKMRTTSAIKNIFDKGGGSMAGVGAVSYMFERCGQIKVKGKGGSLDQEMLEFIDLGAKDVESFDLAQDFTEAQDTQRYLIYTEVAELNTITNKITQAGFEIEKQELIYKPNILVDVDTQENADKVLGFVSRLEESEDVQKVYANFNIPDELLTV